MLDDCRGVKGCREVGAEESIKGVLLYQNNVEYEFVCVFVFSDVWESREIPDLFCWRDIY